MGYTSALNKALIDQIKMVPQKSVPMSCSNRMQGERGQMSHMRFTNSASICMKWTNQDNIF